MRQEGEAAIGVYRAAMGFGSTALVVALIVHPAIKTSPWWVIGLILGLVILISGVIGRYSQYLGTVWLFRTFGPCDLVVKPWPIRLGDEVTFQFFQAHRRRVAVEHVEAWIEIRECYFATAHGDSFWDVLQRRKIALPDAALPQTGQPLRFDWTTRIPSDTPASVCVGNAAVIWNFCVRVATADGPKSTSFDLMVIPEVVT